MTSSVVQGFFIFFAVTFNAVCIPLIGYNLFYFWLLRNEKFVSARQPTLVSLLCIILCLAITFRSLTDATVLFQTFSLKSRVLRTILSHFALPAFAMLVLRVWLLYFQFEHSLHLMDLKWTQQLHKYYTPWTIRYGACLGNWRYLLLFLSAYYLIFITTLLSVHLKYGYSSTAVSVVNMLFYGFMAMVLSIPFFKIQSCRDVYRIRDEIRIIFICAFIAALTYITLVVSIPNNASPIRVLFVYILLTAIVSTACFVMTRWVIIAMNRSKASQISHPNAALVTNKKFGLGRFRKVRGSIVASLRTSAVVSTSEADNSTPVASPRSVEQSSGRTEQMDLEVSMTSDDSLSLEQVLRSKDGFRAFATHLVREFSVENLLFTLRLLQLKHIMIRTHLFEESKVGWTVDVAESMLTLHNMNTQPSEQKSVAPPPGAGHGGQHSRSIDSSATVATLTYAQCIEIYHEIFDTYINPQSVDAVNVKSRTRSNITSLVGQWKDGTLDLSNEVSRTERRVNRQSGIRDVPRPSTQASLRGAAHSRAISSLAGNVLDLIELRADDVDTDTEKRAYVLLLLTQFDTALCEIYRLLENDSFGRWVTTPEYERFEKDSR